MSRRFTQTKLFVLTLALLVAVFSQAAEPDATARKEIERLIEHLASSGCQFNRNGTWYDASRAVSHLKRKYEYLLDKGLVTDAEAFIQHAASQSSASGKPYLVKCANQPETPSAAWFRAALAELRAKTSMPQANDEAK